MTPTVRYLILWLTDDCNLHCRYCYRPPTATAQAMSTRIIDQALSLAAASGKPFHVQLSGGEPTLEPELIAYTADWVRGAALPATLGLQTNGTGIDAQLIRVIKQYRIQVGVSLDGPPAVHEALRGGFNQTYAGLRRLEDNEVEFRVTAVVSAENVGCLDRLALLLGGFSQARGLALDLLVNKGAAVNHAVLPATAKALQTAIAQLLRTLEMINQRRPVPLRWRELDTLREACQRQCPQDLCHACRGESLAVHPDGRVYPCGQTIGDPRFYAGTVEEVARERLNLLGKPRQPDHACDSCPLRNFCPGDCPSRRFYNGLPQSRLACHLYRAIWTYLRPKRPQANCLSNITEGENQSCNPIA
ncbi:MAG: radical SAM protein [Desulfobacca sp.]|nr:radical SAM protein [Desulfobacca sp.]